MPEALDLPIINEKILRFFSYGYNMYSVLYKCFNLLRACFTTSNGLIKQTITVSHATYIVPIFKIKSLVISEKYTIIIIAITFSVIFIKLH